MEYGSVGELREWFVPPVLKMAVLSAVSNLRLLNSPTW